MYLISQVNEKIASYFRSRMEAGEHSFCLKGGRRSGKTFSVAQLLTGLAYSGDVVNVASMTQSQGRLGAYSDFTAIIKDHPTLRAVFECLQSPLEIRNRYNSGRVMFNSYANSETAKGIACDWLFINEANNFTEQQMIDLRANVRKGWIIDFNPTRSFWYTDYFSPSDVCVTTWQDNPFLTEAQLEYFADLKRKAFAPNATELDIRNYKVNDCGEEYELHGGIFTPDVLHFGSLPTNTIRGWYIFADPSALRCADYFASVLVALCDNGCMYVADAFSVNGSNGETRESVCRQLRNWCAEYGARLFVETNGLVGIDFFEFAQNSDLPVEGWYSRGNKFERIVATYGNIRERVVFADTPEVRSYCEQIYEFSEKCAHDDNIDAVVSAFKVCEFS